MRDLYNKVKCDPCVAPQVATNNTAIVGAIIDHKGYDSALYVIQSGTIADSDVTTVVLLEEGDDSGLSDAAAVADADLLGTELLAAVRYDDDGVCKKLGYRGSKRYTRITITPSNNTGNLPISVVCIKGKAAIEPVS